jgi:Zn finger protein HypA/HybF involved in hydrogenase expression
MSTRKSKIWLLKIEELQELFDKCRSVTEILKILGFKPYNGNHRTLNERVRIENIDLTKFEENKKNWKTNHLKSMRSNAKSFDEIFCENSKYTSFQQIKKKLIELNIKDYKCQECGNNGIHNNRQLNLQLDHINGVSNDNRIDNLRFLCPNCHSQTDTFAGRRHKIIFKCSVCNKDIFKNSEKCRDCENSSRIGINYLIWPSLEEVIKLVKTTSFLEAGRILKRSDNSIRKFLVRNGIDLPTLK